MSLSAIRPQVILETVLNSLAAMFLAVAADVTEAREAARQLLAGYNPETPDELTLAAEIVSLQLHTLEALSHAAKPDLALNKILRLRGSAVSLSREQHKAHRKLDQLQRARRAATPPLKAEPAPPQLDTGKAPATTERPAVRPADFGSFQKREAARMITETLKKKQAEHRNAALAAGQTAPAAAGTMIV
jgi:hypothetical protein